MTTRPSVGLPTWATNAAYNSPGDSWDTDPTKATPPAGLQAEGWEPTGVVPAEFMNWWKNNVGQWVEHFDRLQDIEFKNWNEVTPVRFANQGIAVHDIYFDAHGGLGSDRGQVIAATAQPGTTSYVLRSMDGDMWEEVAVDNPNATGYCVSYDPVIGIWVLGQDGNNIESSPTGATWTARTPAYSGITFFMENNGGLFVGTGSTGDSEGGASIQTSPDGINWTLRTNPSAAILGRPHYANSLWLIGGNAAMISSADGLTWTDRSGFLPGSERIFDVHYSSVSGLWVAVGETSSGSGSATILTSPDPTTTAWTQRGSSQPSAGEFVRIQEDADGNLLTVSRSSVVTPRTVFALSRDGGLNWTYWYHGWNGITASAVCHGLGRIRDRFTIFGEARGLLMNGVTSEPWMAHSLRL